MGRVRKAGSVAGGVVEGGRYDKDGAGCTEVGRGGRSNGFNDGGIVGVSGGKRGIESKGGGNDCSG